jgi:hypothetical protein
VLNEDADRTGFDVLDAATAAATREAIQALYALFDVPAPDPAPLAPPFEPCERDRAAVLVNHPQRTAAWTRLAETDLGDPVRRDLDLAGTREEAGRSPDPTPRGRIAAEGRCPGPVG